MRRAAPLYFEHLYQCWERLADIFGQAADDAPAVAMGLMKTPLKRGTVQRLRPPPDLWWACGGHCCGDPSDAYSRAAE